MRSRRRLALFFGLAVIGCVACASRQQAVAGLLATVRRRFGGDTAAAGVAVGRDEFTVRKEKRHRLSKELDRDRELANYRPQAPAPSTQTPSDPRAHLIDDLTGLLNRRALDDALAGEVDRARRFDFDLGLVLIDVDTFKALNDTYGPPAG